MRKGIRSKTMRKRENRRRRRRRHASKVYKPLPISPRLVPEPETSDCPVYRQLVNLGFYLKREKVADCLDELGDSLNFCKKVDICFQKFLFSDLKSCGSGIPHLLGIGIEEDLETTLHGPFIFQVDEIINIRCPPKHRYQQAPPGPGIESRCLQLTLTDGVREVFGMEMEPIEALQPCANPRGLKVEISFIITRDGRLMLVPQNTRVLGGGLADDLSGSMLSQYLAPNLWNREVKAVGLLVSKHRYLLSMLEREVKSQALTRKSKSDDLLTEGCNETSELVVCFGEMLIGSMPIASLPGFKETPSGAPANVAVGISKLGGSSAFISKVGADEFGYMLADILKQNNVDTSGMRFDSNASTPSAFFTIRADGKREFSFFRNPSADMLLDETELDCNLIKKAKIFHYGSMSLIHDPCKYVHLAALRIAKDSDCILSYDPNLRLALWPTAWDARTGIMSIWDLADIIKISEDEITFLTCGGDPYDDDVVLNKLFHSNLKLLIVTEGSGGCRYYTKDFKGKVRGANVEPFDTTGAGDAFVSGILYKIASDPSIFEDEERLQKALYFANVCAAITMMNWGAIPALPTKDAVLHFDANRNIVQL